MKKKNRSQATFDDYQSKIDASVGLARPAAGRDHARVDQKLHTKIGENHGTYMANGVMRVLRLIWRRVRRQHPDLPEPPTMNVDFYRGARPDQRHQGLARMVGGHPADR